MKPQYETDRRGFLRVSAAGVIGTVPVLNAFGSESTSPKESGFGKAKSVLIVMLSGGPSQLDMLDPKPEAPPEVRGEFSAVSTKIPSVLVCEHMRGASRQCKTR